MRVYVFSRTLRTEAYPGVTVIGANAVEAVAALRAESGTGDIWLFGGGELFGSLLAAGQVNAVEVTVVPVLLGSGVVAGGIGRTALRLAHTHRYPTGMVSLIYAVQTVPCSAKARFTGGLATPPWCRAAPSTVGSPGAA